MKQEEKEADSLVGTGTLGQKSRFLLNKGRYVYTVKLHTCYQEKKEKKKEYMPVTVSGFLNGPCMLQTKSPNGEAYIISF